MSEIRQCVRQILRSPGFALIAVVTVALGIGATTAIFSVVYATILRPLPFPDSERLVTIWTRTPFFSDGRGPMGAANHRDIQLQNSVFEDVAILRQFPPANYNLTGDGDP